MRVPPCQGDNSRRQDNDIQSGAVREAARRVGRQRRCPGPDGQRAAHAVAAPLVQQQRLHLGAAGPQDGWQRGLLHLLRHGRARWQRLCGEHGRLEQPHVGHPAHPPRTYQRRAGWTGAAEGGKGQVVRRENHGHAPAGHPLHGRQGDTLGQTGQPDPPLLSDRLRRAEGRTHHQGGSTAPSRRTAARSPSTVPAT